MSSDGGESPPESPRTGGNEMDSVEEIQFNEANGKDGFAFHPDSENIKIIPSGEDQMVDSSPFHFNTIVDYTWDVQYSHGRLIATHLSSMFIAYVVKVGAGGAVRVIDMDTKERVLMKGDKGLIKDVDFMHKHDEIMLGFIDEYGTFYINKIIKELKAGKLTAHPIIKVTLEGSPVRLENRRFIWCKYIPDELKEVASPKDGSYHFSVLQNDIIYAGNLIQLAHKQGEGSHTFREVQDEFLKIDTHSAAVTDASFAPDGTALATCSKDGTVKFFQIYFEAKAPARCLYSWAPHDGRPIDKIFFLDNHTLAKDNPPDSQYWKFMVTAADNCTELKLFTCRSWECLQTINLSSSKVGLSQWKLEINLTARYMVATDIHQKAMYLMHLQCSDNKARFDWVREFSMPWNTIGFNISSATTLKFQAALDKGYAPSIVGDQGSYAHDDILNLLEINVVQPRSMQQGSVAVKEPNVHCRSRSNGHFRISFNRDIESRDVDDDSVPTEAEIDPELSESIQFPSRSNVNAMSAILSSMSRSPLQISSSKANPSMSPTWSSNSLTNQKRRSLPPSTSPNSSQLTQSSKEVPSVAEMSEQLSSLIGLSPGGLTASGGRGKSSSNSNNSSVKSSKHKSRESRGKSTSPSEKRPVIPYAIGRDNPHSNGSAGNITKTSVSMTSNSSSPSREVEEILSPKSTQSFVNRGSTSGVGLGGLEDQELLMLNSNAALDLSSFENGNIPIPPQYQLQNQLSVNLNTKSPQENKKKSINTNKSLSLSESGFQPQIPQVMEKINSLTDLICTQANDIQELKHELGRLTVMHMEASRTGGQGQGQDAALINQILDKHLKQSQTQFSKIEEYLRSIDSSEKLRLKQPPTNQLPQNLAEIVASSVGQVVKKELDSLVPLSIARLVDQSRLEQNVNSQIDRLTSVVEAKLTQNIHQIITKEKIWQSLTTNFQSITKSVFDSTFNDLFMNSVFPRCQSAVQEMLAQVNTTFRNGTKEYLTGLEGVLERERRREDFQELIKQQMTSMQDALSSALQVEVEAQMLRVLGGIQGGVVRQIEDSLSRELSRAFQDQQRFLEVSVIPRTVTPAVSVSESLASVSLSDARALKRKVMELAKSGDVRGAFTQASSLGDADILMQICKSYNSAVLIELNLHSPVHLSIMQLLASDILEDTEVKIDYLNTSILCLDMTDPKNVKGVARLIPVYHAAVAKFEERNPQSNLLSRIKVLQMAFGKAPAQLKSMGAMGSSSSTSLSLGLGQQSHSFSQFQ